MNIPIEKSTFELFPIEFKEINPSDLNKTLDSTGSVRDNVKYIVENSCEKILISPESDGFINNVLQPQIDINHKNTVVINAPVGQGKSYAIIQTVKRFYNAQDKYLIFIASPFVSLVKQYYNDVVAAGIPESEVYSYDTLGRDMTIDYLTKSIQIITVNTLLGNPGEDGFKNSDIKREYINGLVTKCEEEKIKVVFIYDEIHDSYQNFQQQYIFNLWKWKNVIHKNFVLSATFNEAAKVVIQYLVELTDFKIKIIESERKRFPEKQSSLHLHYSSSYNFTNKTKEIKKVISGIVLDGKNLDILCYSKTLAKSLINPKEEIGQLLEKTFGEIKDCTSELQSNQRKENEEPKNQFDNEKCNVGTNFKTGVSIKKDNHAYVIILPPRSTRLSFRNKYGIFSGGINSVIQALARQRRKGDIYIILPKPDRFDYDTLEHADFNALQMKEFKQYYKLLEYHKEPEKIVKYFKLNTQNLLLKNFYFNKLKGSVEREISLVDSLSRDPLLPILKYPTFSEFILEKGEDYLANEIPFFGGDISAYTTYAALSNQFINCKLESINFQLGVKFEEGKVQMMLKYIMNQFFGEDYIDSLGNFANFALFYNDFRTKLFKDFHLKYKNTDDKKYTDIVEGTSSAKYFEIQLLIFIHNLKNKKDEPVNAGEGEFHISDYQRGQYFCDCISNSLDIDFNTLPDGENKNKIELYHLMEFFRLKLVNSLTEYVWGSEKYCFTPSSLPISFFSDSDKNKFRRLLELLKSDKALNDNIFDYIKKIEAHSTIERKLKSFYRMLREDFLLIEERTYDPKIMHQGKRRNVKVVKATKLITNKKISIDLVQIQNYINLD